MILIVQRSESDTAGISEGSLCCAVVRGSFCKGLAGWVYLYDRGGTRRHERLLAALRPYAPVLKIALCLKMLRERRYVWCYIRTSIAFSI
jgi:hypothetical protein